MRSESNLFPIDVLQVIKDDLADDRRPPDGLLHPSSHLIGSLRHAMLDVAGAPKIESDFISDVRLMTGTMWHSRIENALGPVFAKGHLRTELRLKPWLPEGWAGTADWVMWNPEHACWVLGDLKTIKGEGIEWILKDGIKMEHMWQLSSYFWALAETGVPLWPEFGVLYLPMNNVPGKSVDSQLLWGKPLDRELVWGRMEARWEAVTQYLATLNGHKPWDARYYVTDALAPPQEREQRTFWSAKTGVFDLKLVPHWSAAYCPFPTELCNCNEQGSTKIGHYNVDGTYVPRGGFENVIPLVAPSDMDFNRRRREAA
jgi:hypothetical protein